MKKLFVLFAAVLLVLAVTPNLFASVVTNESFYSDWSFDVLLYGDWHSYDYASSICFSDNERLGDGYWIGRYGNPNDLLYGHTLPGLTVPPDQVTRAKLYIDGFGVDSDDNLVQVGGVLEFNLSNWDILTFGDNSVFDLSDVNIPGFWNGSTLDVGIGLCNETRGLRIDRSVLMMDYETSPVPEPATMLLLGMGLLGTGAIFRKKK